MMKNSRKSKPSLLKADKVEAASLTSTTVSSTTKTRPAHVSLEYVQPQAKAVYVAGSFNQWKPEQTPLVKKGNGRWVGDVAVLPGKYEYLFVVDGQWLPDPNARETVQNPFGGQNSVLTVSE